MEPFIHTNFEAPEQVVLDFIKSAHRLSKKCPIGPKGDTETCIKTASDLMHYFTYFKFHPYSDHRYGLHRVKDIKEIDSVTILSKKELSLLTKKNQGTIPVCVFTLLHKNQKWKISNVQIKSGINNFHDLFVS